MIKKITKIKNMGIFDNFLWSQENLNDFKKLNLFFGWNGTGKTTLSRIFRNFELGEPSKKAAKYKNAEYSIEFENGTKISEKDLKSYNNFRVFNKDFIEDNIFQPNEEDCGGIKPIFYLGKAEIELKKEKLEISNIRNQLDEINNSLEKVKTNIDSFKSKAAKHIKDTISTGADKYQNYDKRNFEYSYEFLKTELDKQHNLDTFKLSNHRFHKKKLLIRNSITTESFISNLKRGANLISEDLLDILNKDILNKNILSQIIIPRFKNNLELANWVGKGLEIHEKSKSRSCEFCGQALPDRLLEDLNMHFNKDYKELNQLLEKRLDSYRQAIVNKIDDIGEDKLKDHAVNLNNILGYLINLLLDKQKNISKIIEISETEISRIMKKINTILNDLNKSENILPKTQRELEYSIMAGLYFKGYQNLLTEKQEIDDNIESLEKEYKNLTSKIEKGEASLKDFKLPAENINEDLTHFLNHSELIFKDEKDEHGDVCYVIKRNNYQAYNLSEGEKTAISCVYFLNKLKEEKFDLSKGIIIFDDPVTSLDCQFLYSVYSYICNSLRKENSNEIRAKQVYIFTHNYEFFSLLKKEFCDTKYTPKPYVALYMFDLDLNISGERIAKIKPLDDFLRKYESDYQYIFNKLYEFKNANSKEKKKLAIIYPYPNLARRYLEIFLSFRIPKEQSLRDKIDILTKFNNKKKKDQIYRFININSHGTQRNISGFDSFLFNPSSPSIIDLVLELVEKEDKKHYEILCGSCS